MKDLTKILPYIPHGVKTELGTIVEIMRSKKEGLWFTIEKGNIEHQVQIQNIKLILRPLSQLTEREINNLLEPELLRIHIKEGITPNYRRTDLEYLYSLHADVHNLIESGQAIDVNILETNPYE